jgi:RNA recognition motif-containing protein
MNTRIYFENLSAAITEKELIDLFSAHGNVANVHIELDPVTYTRLNSGFVTMITPEDARAALRSLNGKILGPGTLILSEVSPKEAMINPMNGPSGPRRRASYLY